MNHPFAELQNELIREIDACRHGVQYAESLDEIRDNIESLGLLCAHHREITLAKARLTSSSPPPPSEDLNEQVKLLQERLGHLTFKRDSNLPLDDVTGRVQALEERCATIEKAIFTRDPQMEVIMANCQAGILQLEKSRAEWKKMYPRTTDGCSWEKYEKARLEAMDEEGGQSREKEQDGV